MQNILTAIARTSIIIALPVILVVMSVRPMMSTLFLNIEYNRPGFPEDVYGFTLEDRLTYAPLAIEYLLNNEGVTFLEDLRLPRENVPLTTCVIAPENEDLCYMFNSRELKHMEDVKAVTRYTYSIGIALAVIIVTAVLYLWKTSRITLKASLFGGSVLTLGIIVTIIILALTSWETFFTGFHQVFFEGDSWLFYYSDTLIRLFPEQFWFDAAIIIGILTTSGALIILFISSRQNAYKG